MGKLISGTLHLSEDHAGYALLSGRPNGQILSGGSSAAENLTIRGTSHATPGFVLVNPSGGNVGIGIANPIKLLHLGASGLSAALLIDETNITTPDLSTTYPGRTLSSVFYGSPGSGTTGGYQFIGFTTDAAAAFPLLFNGIHGSKVPTAPGVLFRAGKPHPTGTSVVSLAATEVVLAFRNWTSVPDLLTVYGNGNLSMSGAVPGTSAARVLAIASGTAPTTSPADAAQLWCADIAGAAGKASLHMRNEAHSGSLIVPGVSIKGDTGDPAEPFEGLICINTFDNNLKLYGDGAWRQLATW